MKLIWDEWNTKHIDKHNVTRTEIDEVIHSDHHTLTSYKNRTLFLGRTNNKRLLTIVCSQEKQKEYYIVSARDMSKKERRWYREQTKSNKTI